MMILTGATRVSVVGGERLFNILSILLIVLLLLDITNFFKTISISAECGVMAIMVVIYYLVCILNYSSTRVGLFLRFLWFIMIFFVVSKHYNNIKGLFEKLYNVIFAITLTAIAFFVAINFLNINLPFRYIEHNDYSQFYKEYFYIFCTSMYYRRTNVLGLSFFRLQSFFWEPGIFAIYLNIALAYLTFYKEKKSYFQFLCFLFCMVFTLSTTGICIAVFFAAVFIIQNNKIMKKQRVLWAFPMLLIATITGGLVWIEKMIRTNVEHGSYYIRMRDLLIGIQLMFEKPILGFGYKNYDRFLQLSDQGNSNGLVTWGFTMGLVGIALILFPFIYVIFSSSRENRFKEIIFFVLYVIFNMTEPLLMNPMMLFFLAYEYCKAFKLYWSRRYNNVVLK